jgi:transposase
LSLVGVLGTRYHLTQRKIRNLLDQMMGLSFSVGAISQAHGKVAGALKAPVAQAAATLCSAPALWMDETHYRREGIANWVWAAVQPTMAVFGIYPTRARYVIPDLIGVDCKAVLTTDRYAAYAFVDIERRQVCWAHLLRDFNRIAQRGGLAGRIGRRLHALGLVMFRKARAKPAAWQGARWSAQAAASGAAAWSRSGAVLAHGQDLRQRAAVVARAVDLHNQCAAAADEQRGRTGAAQPGAQAQDLRAHAQPARRPVPRPRLQRS